MRINRRAALAAATLPIVACRTVPAERAGTPDHLALGAARALALVPNDLPGFALLEELAPAMSATGLEDAYGRLGAYSVTYAPVAPASSTAASAEVTCSINTYAGTAHARAAFDAWQAAVPRQYRATQLAIGLPETDKAGFTRDGSILVGFRVRNVLASVRAPQERAIALARLVIARIERSAG